MTLSTEKTATSYEKSLFNIVKVSKNSIQTAISIFCDTEDL